MRYIGMMGNILCGQGRLLWFRALEQKMFIPVVSEGYYGAESGQRMAQGGQESVGDDKMTINMPA